MEKSDSNGLGWNFQFDNPEPEEFRKEWERDAVVLTPEDEDGNEN